MSNAIADTGRSEGPKKNAGEQVRKGAAELNTMKNNFANNEKVQALGKAAKDKMKKVANFFVGKGTPATIESAQLQGQDGGKRRRKSRRKKRRTKRRRKSRRKKRRTKRRRKSRRKRRR